VSSSRSVAAGRKVRSLFVSDLHLGSRFSRVELLLEYLQSHQPQYLYLVGDIVDGWCLKRRWHWPEAYNRLIDRLVELARSGTVIRFTPGNHDEFLRRFLMNNELLTIRNEFVHHGADDRRFVVLHGDLFDEVESCAKWLSLVGCYGYEIILRLDHWVNRVLARCGVPRRRISQAIKSRVKRVVQFVSGFESRVLDYARQHRCDAVVCGHIHMPQLREEHGVLYANLGDWVENSTALVEYDDGRLQLIDVEAATVLGEALPRTIATRVESGDRRRRRAQQATTAAWVASPVSVLASSSIR